MMRLRENIARNPKVDLYVFDFDDTLAETGNLVYVVPRGLYDPREQPDDADIIEELSSEEFLTYELQGNEEFNFSDFNTVRDAEPISHMVKLFMQKAADPSAIVYILTARGSASEGAIERYLDSVAISMGFDGIGIPSRNIVGLGSNAPEDKASKIKNWIVKEHPKTLHYYDDSMKNLREFEVELDELIAYVDSGNASVLTKAAVDGVRGAVFVSHPDGTPREISSS
jgi:hypothetical protein